MKIALIAGPIPYCVSLANSLSRFCDIDFVCSEPYLKKNDSTILQALKKNVTVVLYQEYRMRDPRSLLSYRKVTSLLKNNNYDLIHLQFCGTPGLAFFWYTLHTIPLIFTIHDPVQHPGIPRAQRIVQNLCQKYFVNKAHKFIAHGPVMRQQCLKMYPRMSPDNVIDLPHGDLSVCYFSNNCSIRYEKKAQYEILFFGGIRPNKGIEYLIKAEPYIAASLDNFVIRIAGDGDLSSIVNLIKNSNHFCIDNSFIPHAQVPELFKNADIVVLPYITATQSGIIPLAYAAGKPVVATRTGGLPDVIVEGETGLLVDPCNEIQLAESLIKLLKNDSLRLTMGQNALLYSKEHLSWESIGTKTFKLYQLCIEEQKRVRCQSNVHYKMKSGMK